jgi:prevent-host-death family protein
MRTVGVAELKARLSRYLGQVKAGHEVIVTSRGIPVAKLVPLKPAGDRGSRRAQLAREGRLQLGTGKIHRSLLRAPTGDPRTGQGVLAALLAERKTNP